MAKTRQTTDKINLNLQITRGMLEDFDAAIVTMRPNVDVRPSRSQAVRAAMLEYIAKARRKGRKS